MVDEASGMWMMQMKYLRINMLTNNTEIFKLITLLPSPISHCQRLWKAFFHTVELRWKILFSITAEDSFSADAPREIWKEILMGRWKLFPRMLVTSMHIKSSGSQGCMNIVTQYEVAM